MRKLFFLISVLTVSTTAIQSTVKDSIFESKNIFSDTSHSDLYWEALGLAARGKKEDALKVVEAIRQNTPLAFAPTWQVDQPSNIDDFFNKLFMMTIMRDPQALSELGLFESIGIREHNGYLTDVSIDALGQNLNEAEENAVRLSKYSFEELTREQKVSYKIFSWMLNHAVEGRKFLIHDYKIHQMDGVLAALSALLTQFHVLETADDIHNYIARLYKIPQQFQQTLEVLALQQARGIVPPRFTVEKVIAIIKALTPEQVEENVFYRRLEEQVGKIDIHHRSAILMEAHRVLQEEVYPAYNKLQGYYEQLLETGLENNGVWALPEGEAYYTYMLQHHTTTDLSADEIHALGLKEVARIHREMRQIFVQEGMNDANKSVGALVHAFSKDQKFYYPNTEEGRKQCLADYCSILERSRKELSHLFDLKPNVEVMIQPVPRHEEEGMPAAYYYRPSMDGSRPGTFFVNLRNMAEVPKYKMETLAIHEAEPGHHFQCALQNMMDIPMLRKNGWYTAYGEGWALYTEKLAYEQGFYSSSFAKLGHLCDELLRAVRLVVDTGIHHKRWTREQAVAYMEEATGFHRNSLVTEVERYFVMPGQACAYKIGQHKILELRQRAKEALGEKFDIRIFHNVILAVGCVPLTVLEEVVDQYIQGVLIES